jgi:hypothetical protein
MYESVTATILLGMARKIEPTGSVENSVDTLCLTGLNQRYIRLFIDLPIF